MLLVFSFNCIDKCNLNLMRLSLMDCISCSLLMIANVEKWKEMQLMKEFKQSFHVLENLEHLSLFTFSFPGSSSGQGL